MAIRFARGRYAARWGCGSVCEIRYAECGSIVAARFAFLAQLKRRIGDGQIDLVVQREGGEVLPIYGVAQQHGVKVVSAAIDYGRREVQCFFA